ncbi:MAG: hypothetical protein WBQ23_01200 [Bacteroidota bacterium]
MRKSLFLLCFIVLSAAATAGNPPGGEDDILRPVPWSMQVGPFGGAGWVISQGSFNTLCDCEYGSGSGLGLQLGAFADYPLSGNVSILTTVGFRTMSPSYEKSEKRLEYVALSGGGDFMWVDYNRNTTLSLSMIELGVAAKWELPLKGLYVAVGPEFGWIVSDNIEETETIVTPGLTYDTSGSTKQVFMDNSLDTYYSDPVAFRLGIAGRIGYILPIHEKLAIAPELLLSVPLTPVTWTYKSWRLTAWQFNIYLRFTI